MPESRLSRTRGTLPEGYQYGHQHEWRDAGGITIDTNPPIYTYECVCGAVGQNNWDGVIHETRYSRERRATTEPVADATGAV